MTFIVAGRLPEYNFLMADCISTTEKGYRFSEKVIGLESSPNTYLALSGNVFILQWLMILDKWYVCQDKDSLSDFCSGEKSFAKFCELIPVFYEHYPERGKVKVAEIFSGKNKLNSFCEFIQQLSLKNRHDDKLKFTDNRLIFIDPYNVVSYNLTLKKGANELEKGRRIALDIGQWFDSRWGVPFPKNLPLNNSTDQYESCKKHILRLNSEEKNLDFKDRFAYIELGNGGIRKYSRPFQYISDIFSCDFDIPYESIDDESRIF